MPKEQRAVPTGGFIRDFSESGKRRGRRRATSPKIARALCSRRLKMSPRGAAMWLHAERKSGSLRGACFPIRRSITDSEKHSGSTIFANRLRQREKIDRLAPAHFRTSPHPKKSRQPPGRKAPVESPPPPST